MTSCDLATIAGATSDADPLVALAEVVRLSRETDRLESVLVRRARDAGATWSAIAAALGVIKQAVHKRHGETQMVSWSAVSFWGSRWIG